MTDRVGADRIEEELRHIGDHLSQPIRFTLFGGCCMSVRGIKPSTIDTDAVVDCDDLTVLLRDLAAAGYETLETPGTIVFDNYVVVEREGGIPIDLFPPTRIFDGPGWTPGMRERSEPWFEHGGLEVRLADPSTIFLLKSITGRWRRHPDRDLEDLRRLLARGLVDWPAIAAEWRTFDAPEAVLGKAIEAVTHLREQGFHVGWDPETR